MAAIFAPELVITPVSRWPTTLPDETVRTILAGSVSERVARRRAVERPRASIVMVTYEGLVFSRLCLESLLAAESSTEFEVIVVDNDSADGTRSYLRDLCERDERVRVELAPHNLGFAAATNRGVALSRGDVIVFLNNDTVPVDAWLDPLVTHLNDRETGLVGAVTNRAGNEAEIPVSYRTYGELRQFAAECARANRGRIFDIRTATMFCAALRRDVWHSVGPLDERFEIGLFEDDDFSIRVRRAGYYVVCAEDAFVHHFGQASIGRLAHSGAYGALFHANRERWEAKWGMPWQPFAKRVTPEYTALIEQVRELVADAVPVGGTVLVVSKGDDALVRFERRHGWHFPQQEDGSYAGHYPSDSAACIAELERLRARGAEFLLIPDTARWWLQHYAQFAAYLETHYGMVPDTTGPAILVSLARRAQPQSVVAHAF